MLTASIILVLTLGFYVSGTPSLPENIATRFAPGAFLVTTKETGRAVAILTAGDAFWGYRMAGVPDGLAALDNGDDTFTLFMNHELGETKGRVRKHGGRGAFVSRWVITKPGHPSGDFRILAGQDLIERVRLWNPGRGIFESAENEAFHNFCSASFMPAESLLFGGLGTGEAIFFTGEESDAYSDPRYGRAFAVVVSGAEAGVAYELPRLGDMAFENVVPSPFPQKKTVLIALDDADAKTSDTLGELYVYIGEKTGEGNAIEKAGLNNGRLFGIRVAGLPVEHAPLGIAKGDSASFELIDLGDRSDDDGARLFEETRAGNASGVTKFLRPEDGHWDPTDANVFYFTTTGALYDSNGNDLRDRYGPGRLWKLVFHDIRNPQKGGTLKRLLTGWEGVVGPDNITVDRKGRVYIQEDPGNRPRLARIWRYDPGAPEPLHVIAEHDPTWFGILSSHALTHNEEASGIIDMEAILGEGWFLSTVQAHIKLSGKKHKANRKRMGIDAKTADEIVESGQLVALYIEPEASSIKPIFRNKAE